MLRPKTEFRLEAPSIEHGVFFGMKMVKFKALDYLPKIPGVSDLSL